MLDTSLSLYLDDALKLYEQNPPFSYQERLGETVYIFDDDFLLLIREAFSTDCVVKMSDAQKSLFDEFIAAESGLIPHSLITWNLSTTLANIVQCIKNPSLDDCPLDSVHTFEPCP